MQFSLAQTLQMSGKIPVFDRYARAAAKALGKALAIASRSAGFPQLTRMHLF